MNITNAILKYIQKYYITTDGPIKGPDKLDFEMSAKWLRAAYLSLMEDRGSYSDPDSVPAFVYCFSPSEMTMLLVDDDDYMYHFEWGGDRTWPIKFIRREKLEEK